MYVLTSYLIYTRMVFKVYLKQNNNDWVSGRFNHLEKYKNQCTYDTKIIPGFSSITRVGKIVVHLRGETVY